MFRNVIEKPDLPVTIEMHHSHWDDQLMNYECRDLCAGGMLYDNIDEFDLPQKTKHAIKSGFFNVLPVDPQWFVTHNTLQGYVVIMDTPGGMRILKHQEVIASDQADRTGRFLTEAAS